MIHSDTKNKNQVAKSTLSDFGVSMHLPWKSVLLSKMAISIFFEEKQKNWGHQHLFLLGENQICMKIKASVWSDFCCPSICEAFGTFIRSRTAQTLLILGLWVQLSKPFFVPFLLHCQTAPNRRSRGWLSDMCY